MIEVLAEDPLQQQMAWESPSLVVVPPDGTPREFIIAAASQAVAAHREAVERDGLTSALASQLGAHRELHFRRIRATILEENPGRELTEPVAQAFSEAVFIGQGLGIEIKQEVNAEAAAEAAAKVDRLSSGGSMTNMTSDEQASAQALIKAYKASRTPSLQDRLDALHLP